MFVVHILSTAVTKIMPNNAANERDTANTILVSVMRNGLIITLVTLNTSPTTAHISTIIHEFVLSILIMFCYLLEQDFLLTLRFEKSIVHGDSKTYYIGKRSRVHEPKVNKIVSPYNTAGLIALYIYYVVFT